MTAVTGTSRTGGSRDQEDAQSRLDRFARLLPFPALAVAVALAAFLTAGGFGTWWRFQLGLGAAALAALWSVVTAVRWRDHRPAVVLVQFGGHTLLAGFLVWTNPWYGVFAWTGFILAKRIPSRWASSGVAATGCVMAASQLAGYPSPDPVPVGVFVLVAAFNTTLALSFLRLTERMADQNLERGRMIRELAQANERLETAMAENAGLHSQLVAQAREAGALDERQRMAGEIHDTLAQGLTGIVTQLEAARHSDGARARRHLEQAQQLARASLSEARRSVQALRPEQLEHASLPEALSLLARDWSARTGVTAQVETTGRPGVLHPDLEATFYRVAQEALTNAHKHARASNVWVTLSYLQDVVLLDVRDDGTGFDPDRSGTGGGFGAESGGFGLPGMRHRLARVGGSLVLESAPGEGTALSASAPLEPDPVPEATPPAGSVSVPARAPAS